MKPETVIQIGNVKIWERNGNIIVYPYSSVYDSEFKKMFSGESLYADQLSTGVIPRDPNFLIKDEEGIFHKFNKMEYLGTEEPHVEFNEVLQKLNNKMLNGILVCSKESVVFVKDNYVEFSGPVSIYFIINKFMLLGLVSVLGGLRTYRVGGVHPKPGEVTEKDVANIREIYEGVIEGQE